jgi:DNA-binding MarR family transcriptional regulator
MMADFKQSVSADDKPVLKSALTALEPFKNLNSTMPLQYVTAFILIALDEGQSVTEYAKRAGVAPSVMTRHLADLGDVNRYHEAGFGLVEQETDLADRRYKKVRLSHKGKGVAAQIIRALKR